MRFKKRRVGKWEKALRGKCEGGFVKLFCTGVGAAIEGVAFVVWGLGSSIAVW